EGSRGRSRPMKDIAPISRPLSQLFQRLRTPAGSGNVLEFLFPQGPHAPHLSVAASRIEAYRADRDSWREVLWTRWRGSGSHATPGWETRGVVHATPNRAP